MSWIEVRTRLAPWPDDTSPFVDAYRDHGIENTMEDGVEIVGCLVDVPSGREAVERLRGDLVDLGAAEVTIKDFVETDWENDWKKFFKPRRIGARLVVRPTWEDPIEGVDDVAIVLDPGQAFGTGDHPTTRLCLELLDGLDVAGKDVLDLGCGSGILAIAAKKLGARSVLATDIDPVAVEVTLENLKSNKVELEVRVADRVPQGAWDVAVSNIISATLIRLTPTMRNAVRSGGVWILSGVIEDNWHDVRDVAQAHGFKLIDERHEDGWVAAKFGL